MRVSIDWVVWELWCSYQYVSSHPYSGAQVRGTEESLATQGLDHSKQLRQLLSN